jgi:hypothetical protein
VLLNANFIWPVSLWRQALHSQSLVLRCAPKGRVEGGAAHYAIVNTTLCRALLLHHATLQEAEMCDAADRDLKNALGPLAYVISGAQKLLTASNFKATVQVDGETAEGEVATITVANAAPPFSVLARGHTGECIYDGEPHAACQ